MNNHPTQSRRQFLQTAAAASGGVMVGFFLPGLSRAAAGVVNGVAAPFQPNAFIRIAANEEITLIVGAFTALRGAVPVRTGAGRSLLA